MKKSVIGLLLALPLCGSAYENYYLQYNTSANYVGSVEVDGCTYKAYAVKSTGDDYVRWSVLTARDKTQTRFELPAAVTLAGTNYPVKAIGDNGYGAIGGWYYNHDKVLCEVVLTNGVVELGNEAFEYCDALTNVIFGTSIRSFGNGVFTGNVKLKSVTLPEGLAKMGTYTFKSSGIETVVWPSTMEEVPGWTFYSCSLKTVVWPTTGGPRSIGREAFRYTQLTSIELPDSVTTIDDSVFYDSEKLTSVKLSKNLKSIPQMTFYDCEALTTVDIPEGVTDIGEKAFESCSALSSINLPAGLKTLGQYVFLSCTKLTSVTIPSGMTELPPGVFDYCSGLTSVTLPDGLKKIGNYAFGSCSSLASIEIPDTVEEIDNCAFRSCKALKSIKIPEGITEVDYREFEGCTALTTVTLPSTITNIAYLAFSDCTSLTTINIPDGVQHIGESAFQNCTSLTAIDWPSKLTVLDRYAFSGCTHLTVVTIPASVTAIGDGAFQGCSALAAFTVEAGNTAYKVREGLLCTKDGGTILAMPSALTELRIPDGVGIVRPSAFAGNTALTKIHIPLSVTNMGANAFAGCANIADVTTSGRWAMLSLMQYNTYHYVLTNVTVLAGVERLADQFCYECQRLQKVTLPESLRDLGKQQAFYRCERLPEINLPEGVTNLGNSVFGSCSVLTNVVIPAGVTAIGDNSFSYCYQLESVTIPDGVTAIGSSAFISCKKLSAIKLPAALTTLDQWVFNGCEELREIAIPDGVRKIPYYVFGSCSKLWSVDLPDTVTDIGERAFFNCQALSSFKMPSALQSLGSYAFYSCKSLPAITIPEGVTVIPEYAFESCSGLMSVKLPSTLTAIGGRAFDGCSLLQKVDLPTGLKSLGVYAFGSCSSLSSINLPEGLETYGSCALNYCKALSKIDIPASVTIGSPDNFSGTDKLKAINVADGSEKYSSIGGVLYDKAQTSLLWVPYLCTSLYIPSNTTSVSTSRFSDRPYLETITVSPDNPSYASKDGVLYTKDMKTVLFAGRGLTSVEIADDCTGLPTSAFQYCKGLKTVSVPPQIAPIRTYFNPCYSSLTSVTLKGTGNEVPDWFCGNCTSLREVQVPDTVTRIGNYAFYYCQSLVSFVAPDGLTEIGERAFYNCSALRDCTLGTKLTKIGNNAFSSCNNLDYLELPPTVTYVGTNALSSSAAKLTLLVEGPPPGNIEKAGLSTGDRVLRPRAYSNEWATVGLDKNVLIEDMPEEGVTWTADTTLDWAAQDHVYVHKGVITEDETWTPDKTHVIYGWVTVSNGVTVTLRKGTVVKFCTGMGLLVRNGGTFVGESATFTHVRDDEVGGDSDRDSGFKSPEASAYTIYGHVTEDDDTTYRCKLFRYSGTLGDETWTSGNVYWLTGEATIPKGTTLTIEAGAIVKLGFYEILTVCGTLDVRGTRSTPVIFTSYCDDEYGGDTDGEGKEPGEECWKSILVNDAEAVANISYATFRYGGGRQAAGHAPAYHYGCIRSLNGTTTLEGCTFTDGYWGGIQMLGGSVTAQNCLFTGNQGCAVYSHGGEVTVANSVVYNCKGTVGDQGGTTDGKVTFRNCIVDTVENWESAFAGTVAYDHCCFWNRTDGESGCKWAGADGNINVNPKFIDDDNGDFRIQDDSPCIDAASGEAPERDYWGQTRQNATATPTGTPTIQGRYPDIGLYEVIPVKGVLDAPDLAAYGVYVTPTVFHVGDEITVTYRVKNVSPQNAASGVRRDRIDLVAENGVAYEAGSVRATTTAGLGGNSPECHQGTFRVPAMPNGQVKVRVTVNADHDVFEGVTYDNNRAESKDCTLAVTASTLAAITGYGTYVLPVGGAYSFAITDTLPADTLLVFTCDAGTLRVRSGADALPTDTLSYGRSESTDDGRYLVALPEGSSYLTVENTGDTAASFTVVRAGSGLLLYDPGALMVAVNTNLSELIGRKLQKEWAKQHDGEFRLSPEEPVTVSMRFWGNCFSDLMDVALVSDAERVEPEEVRVFGPHSAYAKFDVTGKTSGLYQLTIALDGKRRSADKLQLFTPYDYVYNSDDNSVFEARKSLNNKPVQGLMSSFPNPVRADRVYQGSFGWLNLDDTNEQPVPLMRLASVKSSVRMHTEDPWESSIDFIPLSATFPAHTLKPDEVRQFDFELFVPSDAGYGKKPKRPKSSGGGGGGGGNVLSACKSKKPWKEMIEWKAAVQNHGDHCATCTVLDETTKEFPWDNNEPYARPKGIGDEAWTVIWAKLKELYGLTWRTYIARLRDQAAKIAETYDEPPALVLKSLIVQTEINRIAGADPLLPKLAQATDAARGGRGVSLRVDRTYGSGLLDRFDDGMFGRGWHSPLEARLVVESDTVAHVDVGNGTKMKYVRSDAESEWENAQTPGSDWLDDDMRQVFRNGSTITYGTNGRIKTMVDVYGNGLTFFYDDAERLEHIYQSDGAWCDFEYEGDAREVAAVVDDLGRRVTYRYDRSGDVALLVQVSAPDMEVAYGYRDADSTMSSRALSRIETPGLPARAYDWNNEGRVTAVTVGDRFTTEYVREDESTCRIVAPDGTVTITVLDAYGHVSKVTDASGNTVKIVYGENGLTPESIESASGGITRMAFTAAGDLSETVTPGGGVTSRTYEDSGNVAQVVDAERRVRKFTYNAAGQMTTTTTPEGTAKTLRYDAATGDLRSMMYFGGKHGFDYACDDKGQLVRCQASNTTRKVTFAYDDRGRVTQSADSQEGATTLAYDATNRLARFTTDGHTYKIDYDGFRGVKTLVDENGAGERYVYDDLGRVVRVEDAKNPGRVYLRNDYDDTKGGVLRREIFGNGVETRYVRDAAGRLAEMLTRKGDTTLLDIVYTYDADGRVTSIRDVRTGTVQSFAYDADGQLVKADYGGTQHSYFYDAIGRPSISDAATTTDGTTGNLLSVRTLSGGETLFAYDEFDRLCGATNDTTGVRWSCAYDAAGHRTRVTNGDVTIRRIAMPVGNVLLDEYQDGVRVRHHVRGNGRRIAVVTPSGVRYLHCDHLGSVRVVTDENGNETGRADFAAFGQALATPTGADAALCGWLAALGVETDPTGLVWMYHRYYSPQLRRFISEDPIGLAAGDVNFFRYCGNNPLSFTDASGLMSCTALLGINLALNALGTGATVAGAFCGPGGWALGMAVSGLLTAAGSFLISDSFGAVGWADWTSVGLSIAGAAAGEVFADIEYASAVAGVSTPVAATAGVGALAAVSYGIGIYNTVNASNAFWDSFFSN